MKKLLLFSLLFISACGFAQRMDTLIVNNDTILKPFASIWVEPVIVNAQGDSARSMFFIALNVSADSTVGCNTYVTIQDKKGQVISSFNQNIPADVLNEWQDDPAPIYNYILSQNPRFKRPFVQLAYLRRKDDGAF